MQLHAFARFLPSTCSLKLNTPLMHHVDLFVPDQSGQTEIVFPIYSAIYSPTIFVDSEILLEYFGD